MGLVHRLFAAMPFRHARQPEAIWLSRHLQREASELTALCERFSDHVNSEQAAANPGPEDILERHEFTPTDTLLKKLARDHVYREVLCYRLFALVCAYAARS